MNLPYRHVPKEFNLNAFWYELSRDDRYDTSNSKGIIIRNRWVHMAQQLLAYGLIAREDSLKVPHLFELYVLYSMLKGDRIDPGSNLVN